MRSLHRYVGTLRFFRRHARLARTAVGRRETRRARIWVAVIRRELAETRAQLRPRYSVPAWFVGAATCLHSHEGAWNSNTGNGYYGGLQFLLSTWASVGGVTRPDVASPQEQIYRAFLVWERDGGSFREWGTAGMCGLA
ncbi:MAG TPA: transglycosylase family protein [Vicinamibacterales bacterium]|nr:transglycosylase family protein [Vicinamibacterales bacterium]